MPSRSADAGHAALLERLADALHAGRVEPEQVERLLADRRAGWRAPLVLFVLGALTAYAGAALAIGVSYPDLPRPARIVLPFAFPLAAFATAITVHRRRAPAWVVEVAAMTAYVALAAAQVVAAVEVDAGAGYATVGGLLSAGLVALVTRLTRALRAAGWGLSSSLVAAATAAAIWADASTAEAPWLYLLEAGAALLVAAVLVRGGREASRRRCAPPRCWSTRRPRWACGRTAGTPHHGMACSRSRSWRRSSPLHVSIALAWRGSAPRAGWWCGCLWSRRPQATRPASPRPWSAGARRSPRSARSLAGADGWLGDSADDRRCA
jgi:hypothetical protein